MSAPRGWLMYVDKGMATLPVSTEVNATYHRVILIYQYKKIWKNRLKNRREIVCPENRVLSYLVSTITIII